MRKIFFFALIIILIFSMKSYAELSFQLDIPSRFIWRGFDLLPDNNPSIQPSITYDFGESGLSLNIWMGFSIKERAKLKYNDEIDLTLSYTFKRSSNIEFSTGFTHYGLYFAKDFRFKNNTSQEVFVSALLPDSPFTPGITVFYDFNLGSGLYINFNAEHTLNISKKLNPVLSGGLGFNSRQYINGTGFSDLSFKCAVPISLGKTIVSPSFNVMIPLMKEVNPKTEWWLGLTIERAN